MTRSPDVAPPPPLLRSPPFDGIPAPIAAVSAVALAGSNDPIDTDTVRQLFAAIREARVGGTFWASPAASPARSALVRPVDADDIARLQPSLGREAIWLLPASMASSHVARRLRHDGATVMPADLDPWSLLTTATTLHAHGDDEWVALAVILGVEVRLLHDGRYGVAGETVEQGRARIGQALTANVAYRDPFADQPTTIAETIALLALWRATIDANRSIAVATGIAWWKRAEVRQFLWAPRSKPLRFKARPAAALAAARHHGGGIAIWPSRVAPGFAERAAADGTALIRVEDGFVRSVGLGSNLFPPLSITVDRLGIHYDPAHPSDLEQLLETASFGPDLLARADRLRRFILDAGISKYGGDRHHAFPPCDTGRRLVLVPGQVEDDMSVLAGGGNVAGNLDLLRRARAAEPDAEIWFRPHPDVDAGHRRGAVRDEQALAYADRVVRGGGMAQLLDMIDGVHVLTSLTGFEALLRGCDVTTHGTPFYAGWGLTRDLGLVPARRRRRLDLLGLIAGVLILYPRYLDPVTGLLCPAEVLMTRLASQVRPRKTWLSRLRAVHGVIMRPWR